MILDVISIAYPILAVISIPLSLFSGFLKSKEQKINSDQLLRIDTLKSILLKFRLLEGLTNKGKENFGYNA